LTCPATVTKLYMGESRLRTVHVQLETALGSKKKWEKGQKCTVWPWGGAGAHYRISEAQMSPKIRFFRPKCDIFR
jgi:hypothetical protein